MISIQISVLSLTDNVELFLRAACIGGSLPLLLAAELRAGFVMLREGALGEWSVILSVASFLDRPSGRAGSCRKAAGLGSTPSSWHFL